MKTKYTLAATTAVVAALALSITTFAQDFNLEPNYGTFNLAAGFLPDPHNVNIVAGGDIDASHLGGECVGNISDAPDVRLNYNGSSISIGATSQVDTTIVVNAPDGTWHCNDDHDGYNPRITLTHGDGQYDIWVGTFEGGTSNATLYFTEY